MGPRFYVAAEGSGWAIKDRTLGTHPDHVRVEYVAARHHGGDWNATHAAAVARCAELNRQVP
jgi:hypothetical protein